MISTTSLFGGLRRLPAEQPGDDVATFRNLKRAYRQITIGSRRRVTLVYLKAEERVIHDRVAQRQHRFMPPRLLRSQFETLEEPGPNEHPVVVTVHRSVAETVTELLEQLAKHAQKM